MPLTLKTKRSFTPGTSPSTAQLVDGELAVNVFDGRLFLRKNNGTSSIIDVANSATIFGGTLNAIGGTIDTIRIGLGGGSIISNIIIGTNILNNNTTGSNNILLGTNNMQNNNIGGDNIGLGTNALRDNVSSANIAIGTSAMRGNNSGNNNIGIGFNTSTANLSGNGNVALGNGTLIANTTSNNVAIGNNAGNNINNINNICIGSGAMVSLGTDTNSIVLGSSAIGLGSNTTVIGNINTVKTKIWGALNLDATVTTTNSATFTINKPAGILTCTAGVSFVVNNSLVTPTTMVFVRFLSTNIANRYVSSVVCGNGNFTITLNGNTIAGTKIGFFLVQTA